jgi:hypothetical protein
MVGDTVILDEDGDLLTTFDQFQGKVIGLGFGPLGSATVTVKVPPGASSLLLIHGRSKAIGAGDSFQVGGTRDTSAAAPTPLDSHADQCSPDGFLY